MKTYNSQPLAKISDFLPNLYEVITLNMLDIQALKAEIVWWELECSYQNKNYVLCCC